MTMTHAIAIAVPLWALATVAVVRFLRYARSDDCLTCLHREGETEATFPIRNPLPKNAVKPPAPPAPPPTPEWPLRRALLLGLAHKWHERADEANRAGDDRTRDVLDQCAASLEAEVRA